MKAAFMGREKTDDTKYNPVNKIIETLQRASPMGSSLFKAFCLPVASCALPSYGDCSVFPTFYGAARNKMASVFHWFPSPVVYKRWYMCLLWEAEVVQMFI